MPDHTWGKALQAEAMDEVDMRIQVLSHLNIETLSSCCLAQWGEQCALQANLIPSN